MVRCILILYMMYLGARCVVCRKSENIKYKVINQRVDLIEEELKAENKKLQEVVSKQQNVIEDLQWAISDMKANTLSPEERDLVSELKWTIFDLKNSNRELEEEACLQSTKCFDWTEWTGCSKQCGTGTRIRSRECVKSGRFSSMCETLTEQEEACDGTNCASQQELSHPSCQDGYMSFCGFCFRFSGRKDTRLLSTIICESEGAHLVVIDNVEKHNLVWDYLNIVAPMYMVDMHEDFSKREYWDFKDIETQTNVAVDGIRRDQTTYFVNWRGEKMAYFNWAVGQPRNSASDGDYCLTINVLTGEWYMHCCGVTFFYICESDMRS